MKNKIILILLAIALPITAQCAQAQHTVFLPAVDADVTFCPGDPTTQADDIQVLQEGFPHTQFKRDGYLEDYNCFHAHIDSQIAAVALYKLQPNQVTYLLYLATAKKHLKKGLAQELINQLAHHTACQKMKAFALADSLPFFKKQGFQKVLAYHMKDFNIEKPLELSEAQGHVTFSLGDSSTQEDDREVLQESFRFTNFDEDFKTDVCMHAHIDNKVVAVALYKKEADNALYLSYIATAQKHRRKQIAQKLIQEIAQQTKCKSINTYALPRAISFFEQQGFKEQENGYRVKTFS